MNEHNLFIPICNIDITHSLRNFSGSDTGGFGTERSVRNFSGIDGSSVMISSLYIYNHVFFSYMWL